MAIRSTAHASTKETPFFLMTGRDFVAPYDLITAPRKALYATDTNYAQELISRLQLAYQEVCQNQYDAFEVSKEQFDKRAKPVPFVLGQIVYVKNFVIKPGSARKFAPKFLGPYRIIEKLGEATFRLRQLYGRKSITDHAEKLKPALTPGSPFLAEYDKEQTPHDTNSTSSLTPHPDQNFSSDSETEPLLTSRPETTNFPNRPNDNGATDSDSDTQDIASEACNPLSNQINESWILDSNTPNSIPSFDDKIKSQVTNDFSSATLPSNNKSCRPPDGYNKLPISQQPSSPPTPSVSPNSPTPQPPNFSVPSKRGRPLRSRQTNPLYTSSETLPQNSAKTQHTTHSYNLRHRKLHDIS